MSRLVFHLDANCVNARQANDELNEIERLSNAGLIEVSYSEVGYEEASAGSSQRSVKADNFTWSGLSGEPEYEAHKREEIEHAVFPTGAATQNQKNDVQVILTAWMCDAILITTDGASKTQPRGILGSKEQLAAIGIQVMSPKEALVFAQEDLSRAAPAT